MQRGDHAPDWIVEEGRIDAHCSGELEAVGSAEERLVLPDRLSLVVEDRPAAAHPAWFDVRASFLDRSGLGLDLTLNGAAKAV